MYVCYLPSHTRKGYQQELCSKMLLDMEQQHPASVLLSLNMSQFSSTGTQQTINQNNNNNNSANNNNNNSGTTNLQQLHDHSSSSPPQTGAGAGGGIPAMTNNSNSGGHFNNYVTLNNNNSQQQNYQNLYNFDTNQYIFSSSGKLKRKRAGDELDLVL